jgi:hypothetical protein
MPVSENRLDGLQVQRADHPLGLLKRVDQPVEQDPIADSAKARGYLASVQLLIRRLARA